MQTNEAPTLGDIYAALRELIDQGATGESIQWVLTHQCADSFAEGAPEPVQPEHYSFGDRVWIDSTWHAVVVSHTDPSVVAVKYTGRMDDGAIYRFAPSRITPREKVQR